MSIFVPSCSTEYSAIDSLVHTRSLTTKHRVRNLVAKFINNGSAHEYVLKVYENSNGLYGTLLDSNGKKIRSKQFSKKADLDLVIAHFDFTDYNSYRIL